MKTPMVPETDTKIAGRLSADAVNWRGQSGRYYALFQEHLENFVLKGQDLYVIARGNKAQWIGTAGDIIEDQASRARFRAAVKEASAVLRFSAPGDSVQRMKAKWDLEGGQLDDSFCIAV